MVSIKWGHITALTREDSGITSPPFPASPTLHQLNFNSSWLRLVQSRAACLLFVSVLVDLTLSSPVHTYPLETSRQFFRGTHFTVDKLLITAYLLFPHSQGKQLPKAITGYVGGEGTADAHVSLSVVLQV